MHMHEPIVITSNDNGRPQVFAMLLLPFESALSNAIAMASLGVARGDRVSHTMTPQAAGAVVAMLNPGDARSY